MSGSGILHSSNSATTPSWRSGRQTGQWVQLFVRYRLCLWPGFAIHLCGFVPCSAVVVVRVVFPLLAVLLLFLLQSLEPGCSIRHAVCSFAWGWGTQRKRGGTLGLSHVRSHPIICVSVLGHQVPQVS